MYSAPGNAAFPALGFPIRISPDQRLLATSPKLFAGCYVLHRHVLSSHPPYALMLYNHCKMRSGPYKALSVRAFRKRVRPSLRCKISTHPLYSGSVFKILITFTNLILSSIVKGRSDPSDQAPHLVVKMRGLPLRDKKSARARAVTHSKPTSLSARLNEEC